MEKLATDIYTFEKLRKGGFTYVDKTAQILPLADNSIGSQFFLSRPRRFGKSLLVSTLRALFEGRKDLFAGLYIGDRWNWSQKWPVIHLDMGTAQAGTIAEFREFLSMLLKSEAERLNVKFEESLLPSVSFRRLVESVAATSSDGQCVVLIDEYDKPILAHLSKPDVAAFRDELKPFYGVVKYAESKLRFTFITGVSKFSKVSIFSDLNNLKDRTMTPGEATLLGYTHDELKKFFPESLAKIAAANGLDAEGAFDKVIEWYDGYRFEENAERVINPVSFGLCAENGKFVDYWSKTALPTFLIEALKAHPMNLETVNVDESELEAYEPANPRLVTLMYQTGYLTIKSCRQAGVSRRFTLCFPNLEVENSFLKRLVPAYTRLDETDAGNFQFAAYEALMAGEPERFVKALKCFFANIPYNLTDRQNEQMWQAIVYVILRSIGVNVRGEVMTNEGRIDMTCETPAAIWLVEFKLDRPADEALAQIEANHYAEKFDLAKKRVVRIGISFSSEQRTITGVKIA